jgi:hypothetical protein
MVAGSGPPGLGSWETICGTKGVGKLGGALPAMVAAARSRCSQTSWVTAGGKLFEQFPGERDKPRMLAEIENKIATSIGGFRERRDEWG